MVDVRKCFVLLALFALIAGGAFAQVTCTLGSAQNLPIRDSGLSELVGTVQMNCTNSTGAAVNVNFSVILSSQITNRLNSSTTLETNATITGTGPDGAPIVGSGAKGVLQHRPETGDVPNTRNQLIFGTVAIPPTVPGGTPVNLLISGVRVKAPAVSTSFTPSTVLETITTSPFGTVNIPNPQTAVVATVFAGLTSALTTCGGSASSFSTLAFAQCVGEPSSTGWNANIRFTEAFQSAFKNDTDEGIDASNGTFLVAKFAKIPAGVKIFVTTAPVITSVTGVTEPVTPSALLTDTTAVNTETLGDLNIALPTCTGATAPTTADGWAELTVGSDGTAAANWEVLAENPTGTDSLSFGILIVFTSNTAAGLPGVTTATGAAQIQAELGPVAGPDSASRTAPIPRFSDNPLAAVDLFNINPCVTNLLFPYVTTVQGFDTGVAISNTSLDNSGNNQPFRTTKQQGTCTAYYFGGTMGATGFTPVTVAPQTTTNPVTGTAGYSISAGEVYAFALSQGGIKNSTSTVPVGFTGYMIVRCNFQFAHGFAFVSDLGAQKLAQGYLALVIPDTGSTRRSPRPSTSFTSNVGEILGN